MKKPRNSNLFSIKKIYLLLLLCFLSCQSKEDFLTLSDLKEGQRAEVIAIEMMEEHLADSALHMRLLKGVGVKVGLKGEARGPKEASRGIIYGFDPLEGNYFGLYEPQASMIKVKIIED